MATQINVLQIAVGAFGPPPSFSGVSSGVPTAPPTPVKKVFLEHVNIGLEIRASSSNLDEDWLTNSLTLELKNYKGDKIEFTNRLIVGNEEHYKEKFPKQSSRSTVMPNYGLTYKSDNDYIKMLYDYAIFLKSGGVPNISKLLGEHRELFASSVGVTIDDLAAMSNCEFFAVVLYKKWFPRKLCDIRDDLANVHLNFFCMDTLIDTVGSYIIKLHRALQGRKYNEIEYRDYIKCNVSLSYSSWEDDLLEMKNYEDYGNKLKELAEVAMNNFRTYGMALPKDTSISKAGGGTNKKPTVNAIIGSKIFYPKENSNRKCEFCGLRYPSEQAHGFPVNYDRDTKILTVLCDVAKKPEHKDKLELIVSKLKKKT
jgi:hypothetical protein